MEKFQSLRISLGLWGSFGVVIGAISILNLTIKYFEFGLSAIFDDLVKTYIWVFHDVLWGVIWKLFSLDVPEWVNDIVTLWFVFCGTSIRTLLVARQLTHYFGGQHGDIESYLFLKPLWLYALISVFLSFLFWPALCVRFVYSKEFCFVVPFRDGTVSLDFDSPNQNVTYRTIWFIQFFTMLGVALIMIVTNAGLPIPRS